MSLILVVEDNEHVRSNISELLSNSGYKVAEAGNGLDALKSFNYEKPDLVLCDIMMPLMDGIEFYSVIRKSDFMVNVPFIFLTAKADLELQNKAFNLGAEDYIVKPFESKNLLNRIKTRLEKKTKIDEKFNRLKDDISLYVPHELQTPIFPIIGYSEMMLNDFDSFSKFELLEMVDCIHNSALRLKNRVEKFNKFAELRIQSIENYVNNQNDLREKIQISEKSFDLLYRRQKERISLNIEKAEIAISKVDLYNLVFELVENACKYSPDDKKITVVGKQEKDKYIISIESGGEPFSIKLIDDFSQPYRKEKQIEGNGLGIAIVSLISQKYNLKIYSNNTPSQNRVFIEFPSPN